MDPPAPIGPKLLAHWTQMTCPISSIDWVARFIREFLLFRSSVVYNAQIRHGYEMDMPCIWQWHRLFALKVKQHIWYDTIGCLLEIKTLVTVSSSVFAFAPTISFGGELWLVAVVAWATPAASVVLFGDCVSKQKMPFFFLFSSSSFGLFICNSGDRLEHLRL